MTLLRKNLKHRTDTIATQQPHTSTERGETAASSMVTGCIHLVKWALTTKTESLLAFHSQLLFAPSHLHILIHWARLGVYESKWVKTGPCWEQLQASFPSHDRLLCTQFSIAHALPSFLGCGHLLMLSKPSTHSWASLPYGILCNEAKPERAVRISLRQKSTMNKSATHH